jgi:hypothetical protein
MVSVGARHAASAALDCCRSRDEASADDVRIGGKPGGGLFVDPLSEVPDKQIVDRAVDAVNSMKEQPTADGPPEQIVDRGVDAVPSTAEQPTADGPAEQIVDRAVDAVPSMATFPTAYGPAQRPTVSALGSGIDWKAKEQALTRAFLNAANAESPVDQSSPEEDFKNTFNWLLCIVFPQGARERKTINRSEAQAFYEKNFFPEEIVSQGHLISAKTMEMETRAFIRAFDRLPGKTETEKYYERPFGNLDPQSFMELVRNAIVVKLEAHAGLVVRSCFSRDRRYVYILVSSALDALTREAERSRSALIKGFHRVKQGYIT